MGKTKHTPGPWFVGLDAKGCQCVLAEDKFMPGNPWYICKLFEDASYGKTDPIKYNAALIAAAPELLEALQSIISQDRVIVSAKESGPLSVFNEVVAKAKAAIAKATNTDQS